MRAWLLPALAGSIALLMWNAAPAAAQEIPAVQIVQTSTHPAPPPGWKVACMPNAVNGGASPTCPVLKYNGSIYWAWSDDQNAVAMAIVAYDSNGTAIKQWNRNGARYIWNLTVDDVAQTVSFIGQANAQIQFGWNNLFIPQAGGDLTFVNVSAQNIACAFATSCAVTVTDTTGTIQFPPGVTGTGTVQSRTFTGAAGAPGAGKIAYEYRVDMTGAVSGQGLSCVTDLAVDFGPNARLSFDGTGQSYDAFAITQGGIGTIGLFNVARKGNTIDFVFAQPVCAGSSEGGGQSSLFVGIASSAPPRAVAANVGWPGLLGEPAAARAPAYLMMGAHRPLPLKLAVRRLPPKK